MIHLNAFALATPSPQFSGMWKHPEDRSASGYRSARYWVEFAQTLETGLDGFNIVTSPHPTGFERFVDHVVPELQRRGLFRTEYEESTLRERYLGVGRQRLPRNHPGRNVA